MQKERKNPFPDLPPVRHLNLSDLDLFTRQEVAVMLNNLNPSIISKDASALGIQAYNPLTREDVWSIYLLRFYVSRVKPGSHRSTFVQYVQDNSDEAVIKLVEAFGGGRKHFEKLLNEFIRNYRTGPSLPIQTITVEKEIINV